MTDNENKESVNILDIDKVLIEIGSFGRYQLKNAFLIGVLIMFCGMFQLSYVFTAGDLNYRCKIPKCDTNSTEYRPVWLENAVPYKNGNPTKCEYYTSLNDECNADSFNKTDVNRCSEFIYEDEEKTILNEWGLTCLDNKWKLTLAGTIHTFGQFLCFSISGVLSDKYGRRTILIFGMVAAAFSGVFRSLSWNYISFLVFEFLDRALGAGSYIAAYIIRLELVEPKNRVYVGGMLNSCFAFGEFLLGLFAMYFQDWRLLLRFVYAPAFLFIFYIWLVPESIRWLHTKGKSDRVLKILNNAAAASKVELSVDSLKLMSDYEASAQKNKEILLQSVKSGTASVKKPKKQKLVEIFKYPVILMRLITCSFIWITITFVYYGLSLNAVSIGGNKYVSFMLVCLIEIPAHISFIFLANKFGRRKTLSGSLIVSGLSCLVTTLAADVQWLKLVLFLTGKFSISISFTIIYVYASELFPTTLRHTLVSTGSTFGRIGSMIAPQTPLLADIMKSLPLLLFGGTAVLAGLLGLRLPETLNKKLPDTLQEATEMKGNSTVA